MGAQLSAQMEKSGALLVSSLARRYWVIKEHGDGALNQILGSLVTMGNLVNLATMVDLGFMVNLASTVSLASMVAQGFMVVQGSTGTMGSKKLPLDVAKSRFNTKDKLTITVLALVIRVRGATLMGLKTLKHGATVRN